MPYIDPAAGKAPSPNPNEKLLRVFDTELESEALVVRGLLDSGGIDCQVSGLENSPDVLPVGGYTVLVREEDAAKARQLIAEYRRTPGEEQAESDDAWGGEPPA